MSGNERPDRWAEHAEFALPWAYAGPSMDSRSCGSLPTAVHDPEFPLPRPKFRFTSTLVWRQGTDLADVAAQAP